MSELIGKKFKIDFAILGLIVLIITSIFNTSKYGASLSWVLVGAAFIVLGGIGGFRDFRAEKMSILLFWLAHLVSTVFSDYVSLERDIITFLIFCIVYLCATSREYGKDELKLIISAYIVTTFLCEINILYNWLTRNYYNSWFHRVSFSFMGVYKDPNYTMAFVVPGILMSFFRTINHQAKGKLFNIINILLGLFCILVCGSRAALLTMVLSFVTCFFFSDRLSNKRRLQICISVPVVILLAFGVMSVVLPPQSIERLFSLEDSRIEIWATALEVFRLHPIIGGGMSAASSVTLEYLSIDSHNVYLDILCNSGLVGSTIFVLFFCFNCLKCKKSDRAAHYSLIVAFMFPMFFINGFNTATFYLPLILLSIVSEFSVNNIADSIL